MKTMKKTYAILALVAICLALFPTYSRADAVNGVTAMFFDALPGINPKVLPLDGKIPYTFSMDFDLTALQTYCGANNTFTSFKFSVLENYDGKGVSGEAVLAVHDVTFQRANTPIHAEENGIITAKGQILPTNSDYKGPNINRYYFGIVDCPNGKRITESSPGIGFVSPQQANTYACVVKDSKSASGYTYICSSKGLPKCDDVQCGGSTCTLLSAGLCNTAVPADSSGNPVNPAPAVPIPAGQSQTYSYSITNPLVGGPNDLFDIINIVTQWIIYITVPLAVLWIMYAGFLMLTAGPTPANFQKGRDILKYTVMGLAIIFIGKGFVSLIISIIQLGGTGNTPPTTQNSGSLPVAPGSAPLTAGTMVYGCYAGDCTGSSDSSVYNTFTELSQNPTCLNTSCAGTSTNGSQNGSTCNKGFSCLNGLVCNNNICQNSGGNFVNDPCLKDNNCKGKSTCDLTQKLIVDGQTLGTCIAPAN